MAYPNHCKKCRTAKEKQVLSLEEAQEKINSSFEKNEYSLLEYQSYHQKALIRHNYCNFIWTQNYAEIISGKGCPKCNRNKSKGEIAIDNFFKRQ